MGLSLFRSTKDPGVYGITTDASGCNLPDHFAPWRDSSGILADGGLIASLVSSDAVHEVVTRDGFYLARTAGSRDPAHDLAGYFMIPPGIAL
jgi:hypothetical protein